MQWITRMVNLTRNMNKVSQKGKGRVTQPPRSRSTNSNHSQPVTRTLKSQSTSAMDNKSAGLVDSMRNMNISQNRVRSAVRIPVRSSSTSTSLDSMEDLCYYIQKNKVKNVVVMAGAGISTSSGIPDFRTPGTGLYDNLRQYKIPYPEAIFDIDYFHYNPRPFFTLAKDLFPNGVYQPNTVHYFCRLLHDKGLLLRMYTQNIDGLERVAGIPANKLVEAHGTFSSATCVQCRRKHDGDEIKDEIVSGKLPMCRSTLSCSGIIKPDIVFFGEDLPKKFWYYLKDFPQADMLIVMGTSLEVEPFAGIVDYVRFPVPRVLFNLKAVGPFKKRRRMNDVCIKGDLVENIAQFIRTLGWENDYVTVSGQSLPSAESESETESQTETESKTECESKTETTLQNGHNGMKNQTTQENGLENGKESETSASGDANRDVIQSLRRNETPLQNNRRFVTNTKSEHELSSPVKNRKFHTRSAHPNRLLTKRGSTGSMPHQKPPVAVSQKVSTLPKLAETRRKVNSYKETLEKLRRWRMDSTSESTSSSESD